MNIAMNYIRIRQCRHGEQNAWCMYLGLENLGRLIVGEPSLITRNIALEQPFDHLVRLLPVRYRVRRVVAYCEEGKGSETGGVVVCESGSDTTAPIGYRKVRIRDMYFQGETTQRFRMTLRLWRTT